jgi:hypothetical protein
MPPQYNEQYLKEKKVDETFYLWDKSARITFIGKSVFLTNLNISEGCMGWFSVSGYGFCLHKEAGYAFREAVEGL